MNAIPKPLGINNPRRVDMPLHQSIKYSDAYLYGICQSHETMGLLLDLNMARRVNFLRL